MFGRNEIVGQKYFTSNEQAQSGKLFVTSIFYTLQGEGVWMGCPAVFVRLAKCNLNCSFCDTFFDDGDWLTPIELSNRIYETVAKYHDLEVIPANHDAIMDRLSRVVLVCTGGEPMLQKNLGDFLHDHEGDFLAMQIESNGLIWQELPSETTLIVSPKCSEKTGKYLNPNEQVLERVDALKFVVSADPESPYHTIPDWALDLAGEVEIFVSPMNIYNEEPRRSKELRLEKNYISIEERSEVDEVISFWTPGLLNQQENQKNHEYAAKYALKHGLRLNLQMHLYASLA